MTSGSRRTLLVAHRLPIALDERGTDLAVKPANGGLATALRAMGGDGVVWIGWPGEASEDLRSAPDAIVAALAGGTMVPVHLSRAELTKYYDGFANGVLWPLFHYLLDKVDVDAREAWTAYVAVNQRFADAVASTYRPGDRIWVHDYQLALAPRMLRERFPEAPIGFFLHIPFPGSDVFRLLPWRSEILEGILGADLVGFHTEGYRAHFVSAVGHVLEQESRGGGIVHRGVTTRVRVFPIGVDVSALGALARGAEVEREARRIREHAAGRRLLLGVDRLDYTKGIRRRLLGFERFLELHPGWVDRVRYVQIAVPTRERIAAYGEHMQLVASAVSRVNGRFGTVYDAPVHLLNRSITEKDLAALYRAADVMLVTPLRDGMNLVAKEYVATHVADDGALVLSEFAGAAAELSEALLVNPYDVDGIARAIHDALTMSDAERAIRMRALRRRIEGNSVQAWAAAFLDALPSTSVSMPPLASDAVEQVLAFLKGAPEPCFVLSYEGTLVPHAATPELAGPDEGLRELLTRLAWCADVHVVSALSRQAIDAWLGGLDVSLHAEQGYCSRPRRGAWTWVEAPPSTWKEAVRPVLEAFRRRVPGSFLEEKESSFAWHHRGSESEALRNEIATLGRVVRSGPGATLVECIASGKVLEVRLRRPRVAYPPPCGARGCPNIVTIGEAAASLSCSDASGVLTVRVGVRQPSSALAVDGPADVRALLATVSHALSPRRPS